MIVGKIEVAISELVCYPDCSVCYGNGQFEIGSDDFSTMIDCPKCADRNRRELQVQLDVARADAVKLTAENGRLRDRLRNNVTAYLKLCNALGIHGSADYIAGRIQALKNAQAEADKWHKKFQELFAHWEKDLKKCFHLKSAASAVYDTSLENDRDPAVRRLGRVLRVIGATLERKPDGSYVE